MDVVREFEEFEREYAEEMLREDDPSRRQHREEKRVGRWVSPSPEDYTYPTLNMCWLESGGLISLGGLCACDPRRQRSKKADREEQEQAEREALESVLEEELEVRAGSWSSFLRGKKAKRRV